jgi:geranylgeranyl reductase family protein
MGSSLDLLVIGAGPAGSAAAFHASRAGLRVLIIDSKAFPRGKTCGDALTPRALAAVERMRIRDLPGHRIRGVQIVHDGALRYEDFAHHAPPHYGLVVLRNTLDAFLLDQARDAGAAFQVAHARRLLVDGGRVTGVSADTANGTIDIAARTVIAATGSRVSGALLGLRLHQRRRVCGIAGRTYLDVQGHAGEHLEVYLPLVVRGRVVSGYGWVFPVGPNRVNIGAGIFRTDGTPPLALRSLIRRFIAERARVDRRLTDADPNAPIECGPIAIGPAAKVYPGLIRAGDAAGVANLMTGEGIAFALESGELAARAVLDDGEDAAARYRTLLRERLPRHFHLRPALAAMHERPALLLRRGADLVTNADAAVASGLHQLLWDHAPSLVDHGYVADIERVVSAVRTDVIQASTRMRPLFGQLVSYLTAEPRVGFGWYAAFTGAVRVGSGYGAAELPQPTRSLLVALELVNLVSALHRDLPVRESSRRGRIWGRQTLSLMVADTLTAHALKLLYGLDAAVAARSAAAARGALRHHAAARSSAAVDAPQDARAEIELFLIAAQAAFPSPGSALPHFVTTVAARLGAMRRDELSASTADLAALEHTLRGAPDPLGRALASMLSAIARLQAGTDDPAAAGTSPASSESLLALHDRRGAP